MEAGKSAQALQGDGEWADPAGGFTRRYLHSRDLRQGNLPKKPQGKMQLLPPRPSCHRAGALQVSLQVEDGIAKVFVERDGDKDAVQVTLHALLAQQAQPEEVETGLRREGADARASRFFAKIEAPVINAL